jgi:hypothetical protein
MTTGGHPNVRGRTPRDNNTIHVLALGPEATIERIESELASEAITLQIARSVPQAVAALVDDPPPRATILIADFDALTPPELLELHSIRERGWFGSIIGIGDVPNDLRTSLAVANVLPQPLRPNILKSAISRAGIGIATTKMPRL